MFFMIAIGIIAGMFVRNIFSSLPDYAIAGIRLLILPLIVGIGYEFIRFAGKHDNVFTRVLSAPGLWVQRITTKEPTEDMLEIAIISIKCALRDDYPEFKEFFENKSWEKKEEPSTGENPPEASSDSNESSEIADTDLTELFIEEVVTDTESAENESSEENEI